jgi:gentisate 1,2-dioxygenase
VRQYQSSIQTVVEDKGFELASAHSLWVKHTTLRVREPKRKLVPALEKRAEVAPTISRSEAELEAR